MTTPASAFAPTLPTVSAQVERLIDLGIHEAAELSARSLRTLGDGGAGLFALHPSVLPASALAPFVHVGGRRAFVVSDMADVDDFAATIDLPDATAYVVDDPDRGDDMRNWSPDEAAPAIAAADRTPMLVTEGLHWLLHQPDALERNHCFMTIGSRKRKGNGSLDTRTPALWISNGTGRDGAVNRNAPKVGWCWWGNRHTWLGMASAAGRRPIGTAH